MPVISFASYYAFPDLRGQLMMMLHSGSESIFSGCLLAICMVRHPQLAKKLLLPWWGIAGLLLYFYFLDTEISPHMPRGYGMIVGITLITLCITVFLANVLRPEATHGYQRFLEFRPLVYLGRISYSVYLWQQLFTTPANTTWTGKFPLNVVIAIAVGWLSYQFIEVPFIRLKDKYFPPHTKPATGPIPSLAPAANVR
jgi:peptidoglycan/LPS O-acetylase OafA/YrhL